MIAITISGKAESGKDTFAIALKDILEKEGKKIIIIHYADYLKFVAKQYFNWSGQKDVVGRGILQTVGTEMVRSRSPDFWVNAVTNLLEAVEDRFDFALIPDARFINEIEVIKGKFETVTVKVVRLNYENSLTEEQRKHLSETELDEYSFDYVVEAESGAHNLFYSALEFSKLISLTKKVKNFLTLVEMAKNIIGKGEV